MNVILLTTFKRLSSKKYFANGSGGSGGTCSLATFIINIIIIISNCVPVSRIIADMTQASQEETSPLLCRQIDNDDGQLETGKPVESGSGGWRWPELRLVASYAIPMVATYLLQYCFGVVTTFVAGHLGADDLAAASIGLTTLNIVGLAIIEGMATALDTLCAQAYGSGNATKVGLHVQRMLLLMAAACVPIGTFWYLSAPFLGLFVRQKHLAAKAGSFLRMSIIGLPGYAAFEAGKRFLQAQGDFRTAMAVLIICAPVNAFLSWLFAFHLDMGLDGAALGAALANDLRPVLLLLFTMYGDKSKHQCWAGFSRQALKGWGPMMRLSIAGSAVTLAEWGAFEIITFSTSYLSTTHLAVQSILITTAVFMWHIPFSLSVAVSTRIGHLIGAGDVSSARRAAKLYAVLFIIVGVANGLILFSLRNVVGPVFSTDKAIQNMVASHMLAVASFQLVDAIMAACNGMLRGLGRQHVAAWVAFFANYFVGVPLAIWLELGPWGVGLNGAWIGLGTGMFISAVIEGSYIGLLDWRRCLDAMLLNADR